MRPVAGPKSSGLIHKVLTDKPELKEAVSNEGLDAAAPDLSFFRKSHQVQNLNLALHTYARAETICTEACTCVGSSGSHPRLRSRALKPRRFRVFGGEVPGREGNAVQRARVGLRKRAPSRLKTAEILHLKCEQCFLAKWRNLQLIGKAGWFHSLEGHFQVISKLQFMFLTCNLTVYQDSKALPPHTLPMMQRSECKSTHLYCSLACIITKSHL